MHVLYLPSWYPLDENDLNGCFFREQAHVISKLGHQVGVISPQFRSLRLGIKAIKGSYKTQIWQDEKVVTYSKHDVFWFPKIPYLDLRRWVNAGLMLFEKYITIHGKPDIVHVQSMLLAGPLALEIFKKYQIPYCITEHSSTFARGLVNKWQFDVLSNVVQHATKCLAVSQSLVDLLEQKFIDSKWNFCPNLLDQRFVQADSDNTQKVYTFCAVARLHYNKGFDLLLQAFSIFVKKYPNTNLVIGGDGPEKENLIELAVNLNLREKVIFLGQLERDQVKNLMRESRFYVVSSHVETFGVVVIEALSQGIPVISTKCGGPESILTSEDGYLVDVNNVNALVEGMENILANAETFNQEKIRSRCLERFSEKSFSERILKIYQVCMEKA